MRQTLGAHIPLPRSAAVTLSLASRSEGRLHITGAAQIRSSSSCVLPNMCFLALAVCFDFFSIWPCEIQKPHSLKLLPPLRPSKVNFETRELQTDLIPAPRVRTALSTLSSVLGAQAVPRLPREWRVQAGDHSTPQPVHGVVEGAR